jgi:hypothetical protein
MGEYDVKILRTACLDIDQYWCHIFFVPNLALFFWSSSHMLHEHYPSSKGSGL